MEQVEILIPYQGTERKPWQITAPWLKLSLKYGLVGPWTAPNKSVAFDRYSLSRGPSNGPPTIGDFAITTLMNSNVTGDDLAQVSDWLVVPENSAGIAAICKLLAECDGLRQMPDKTVDAFGALMGRIEKLPRIKTGKVAKWFCAWAPAHVPMIDQYVGDALLGAGEKILSVSWSVLLNRYKAILIENFGTLESLGARLSQVGRLSSTVPPVRILDSLIWFDWWACYEYPDQFSEWVKPDDAAGQHALTEKGRDYDCSA